MTSAHRPTAIKRRDVLLGLSVLAVAALLTLLAPQHFELGQRILGVMGGLFVVFFANAIPKALKPLAKLKDPARHEALQRFIGWCLVLGGLGYALAWIVVPFAYVIPVAIALLGSSLAIASGRCFWVRRLA
jgi:hypothetical protein